MQRHQAAHVSKPVVMPTDAVLNASATSALEEGSKATSSQQIMHKLKALEAKLAAKAKAEETPTKIGKIKVNGPIPHNFEWRFAKAVEKATGCSRDDVRVVSTSPLRGGLVLVVFEAPEEVVEEVKEQVSDPESHLANSELRPFFVAKDTAGVADEPADPNVHHEHQEQARHVVHVTQRAKAGIDIDTEMPFGDLEPFGREDTGQELTESSVKESDDMVDQLERAEVAEEKRAVFRALTRLRGVAISSFDAVARAQANNLDQYSQSHKWRDEHPLHHLADDESDVKKWAFPDSADF